MNRTQPAFTCLKLTRDYSKNRTPYKPLLKTFQKSNSHKSLLSKTYRNSHSITRTLIVGIYCFTKNEVIHRCFSRNLIAPSAGSFTVIFKLKVLLSIFCGTKITLEWTTHSFLDQTHATFSNLFIAIHKILSSFSWVADVIIEAIQILF